MYMHKSVRLKKAFHITGGVGSGWDAISIFMYMYLDR